MKPIASHEILALADYERARSLLRPLLLHEKDRRRLHVGPHVTLLFENAQTAWYQIQEMIRTEKLESADAINHEIETYNELLPRKGELAATMLIEYADAAERDAALRRLVGLESHLWINFAGRRERASFDNRQMSNERISSVQFVRFPVGSIDQNQFLELAHEDKVAIEVDHPSLAAHARIAHTLAHSLAEDLA